jgi:hypothetical protein
MLGLAAAAAILTTTGAARADLYEHTFTGEVTALYGTVPDPWSEVHVGSRLALSYIFDTEMEDQHDSPHLGWYELIEFSVVVEGAKQTASNPEVHIETTPTDEFYFSSTEQLPIALSCVMYFQVPGFFQTDEFPLYHDMDDPGGFWMFELLDWEWKFAGEMSEFHSRPVPAPAAGWALVLLIGVRSRRRGRRQVRSPKGMSIFMAGQAGTGAGVRDSLASAKGEMKA